MIRQKYQSQINQLEQELVLLKKNDLEAGKVSLYLARCYVELGEYNRSLPLFQRAVEVFKLNFHEDHPRCLEIMHEMGVAQYKQGLFTEAGNLLRSTLKNRKLVQGEDSADTIQTLKYCAYIRLQLGQEIRAGALLERYHQLSIASHGATHPTTLSLLPPLALFYLTADRAEEAVAMLSEGLEQQRAELKEGSADMFETWFTLCLALRSIGHTDQAKTSLEACHKQQISLLGSEHPDTLRTLYTLAGVMKAVEYDRAEIMSQTCLTLQQRVLGDEHIDTASTKQALSMIYFEQGRLDEAKPLLEQSLPVFQKALGASHQRTLLVERNLTAVQYASPSSGLSSESTKFWTSVFMFALAAVAVIAVQTYSRSF